MKKNIMDKILVEPSSIFDSIGFWYLYIDSYKLKDAWKKSPISFGQEDIDWIYKQNDISYITLRNGDIIKAKSELNARLSQKEKDKKPNYMNLKNTAEFLYKYSSIIYGFFLFLIFFTALKCLKVESFTDFKDDESKLLFRQGIALICLIMFHIFTVIYPLVHGTFFKKAPKKLFFRKLQKADRLTMFTTGLFFLTVKSIPFFIYNKELVEKRLSIVISLLIN